MKQLHNILQPIKAFFIRIVIVRFKAIKSRFTMKNTGRCLFVDKVNGREVWFYKDCFGVEYMAQSKWEMRCER